MVYDDLFWPLLSLHKSLSDVGAPFILSVRFIMNMMVGIGDLQFNISAKPWWGMVYSMFS
jgi:hypothetical protein